MKDIPQEYRVTYYKSTHPCVKVLSFLLIAFIISRIVDHHPIPPR